MAFKRVMEGGERDGGTKMLGLIKFGRLSIRLLFAFAKMWRGE